MAHSAPYEMTTPVMVAHNRGNPDIAYFEGANLSQAGILYNIPVYPLTKEELARAAQLAPLFEKSGICHAHTYVVLLRIPTFVCSPQLFASRVNNDDVPARGLLAEIFEIYDTISNYIHDNVHPNAISSVRLETFY